MDKPKRHNYTHHYLVAGGSMMPAGGMVAAYKQTDGTLFCEPLVALTICRIQSRSNIIHVNPYGVSDDKLDEEYIDVVGLVQDGCGGIDIANSTSNFFGIFRDAEDAEQTLKEWNEIHNRAQAEAKTK